MSWILEPSVSFGHSLPGVFHYAFAFFVGVDGEAAYEVVCEEFFEFFHRVLFHVFVPPFFAHGSSCTLVGGVFVILECSADWVHSGSFGHESYCGVVPMFFLFESLVSFEDHVLVGV